MPTRTKQGDDEISTMNRTIDEAGKSWTDDLPVCQFSGVGFGTNQVYRLDGNRRADHEFEDRSFHFRSDEDTYLYGVFDGQFGSRAADFAFMRMPAEILLGQLKDKTTDQEIKDVMQQAFVTVENSFFQSIDNLLAEKENLRLQLQGLRTYEAMQKYPDAVQRLNQIIAEIESGSTATVALIHKSKLYVANVGNTRAVLCRCDESGETTFHQLTVDHDFKNEDELLRLTQLGLDRDVLVQETDTRRHKSTRCLGNYAVKGGYKEFDHLSNASEEPVLAEAEVVGGIELDKEVMFLVLMSSGVYESLEQATGTENANGMVVQMLIEQFEVQSTMNGVAQAVVDKVVRIHHDAFTKNNDYSKNCQKRSDITLLVRNFNQPLPNYNRDIDAASIYLTRTDTTLRRPVFTSSNNDSPSGTLSNELAENTNSTIVENDFRVPNTEEPSLSSTDSVGPPQTLFQFAHDVSLDEDQRIKPYVDFTDFYEAVEEAYTLGDVPKEWRAEHFNS